MYINSGARGFSLVVQITIVSCVNTFDPLGRIRPRQLIPRQGSSRDETVDVTGHVIAGRRTGDVTRDRRYGS